MRILRSCGIVGSDFAHIDGLTRFQATNFVAYKMEEPARKIEEDRLCSMKNFLVVGVRCIGKGRSGIS